MHQDHYGSPHEVSAPRQVGNGESTNEAAVFATINSSLYTIPMNRPPPYFPQNQLSPPDENRYKKFKIVVGGVIFILTLLAIAAGVGIYYLVSWLMS
jgi:hypothetical protein